MKVILLKSAKNDLKDTHSYISRDNPTRADSFFDELMEKAMDIGKYPQIFPAMPDFPHLHKRSFKGYIIIYTVIDDAVYIIHILNSMRDYGLLLKKRKQL